MVHQKSVTVCAHLHSAKNYSSEHFNANLKHVQSAKLLYMTGYFISTNFDVMMQLCELATTSGVPLAFNVSHGIIFDFYQDQVRKMLPHLDIVFANKEEIDKWAQFQQLTDKSLHSSIKALLNYEKANAKKTRTVIVTQGGDGPVVVGTTEGITEYPVDKLTTITDNYGRGDAFTGGFLSQMIQGKDLATCARFGIHMAKEIL